MNLNANFKGANKIYSSLYLFNEADFVLLACDNLLPLEFHFFSSLAGKRDSIFLFSLFLSPSACELPLMQKWS